MLCFDKYSLLAPEFSFILPLILQGDVQNLAFKESGFKRQQLIGYLKNC